jgi:DNA polymerase-3 subunit chi
MTRVDVYEIKGSRWEHALCERVEMTHRDGRRVYVWAASEAQARQLDELLWTFREDSFVPHDLWTGVGPSREPVAVGWAHGNPNAADCLVLARDASPQEIEDFPSAIDFAAVDLPALRDAARGRYRTFRSAGFHVEFHSASP